MPIDDIRYQIRGAVLEVNREKAEIKRLVLELPEGQRKKYPATSAGYCLRQSNERSERAAIKYYQMQGVGRTDGLLYFKCPATKKIRCSVNAYESIAAQ